MFDLKAAKSEAAGQREELECISDHALVGEMLRRIKKHETGAKADEQKTGEFLYDLIGGVVPHSYWKGSKGR